MRLLAIFFTIAIVCSPADLDPKVLTFKRPSKTEPMPAGSFVSHTAGGVHFDGAKDQEVIVLVSGMGPGTTVNVQAK